MVIELKIGRPPPVTLTSLFEFTNVTPAGKTRSSVPCPVGAACTPLLNQLFLSAQLPFWSWPVQEKTAGARRSSRGSSRNSVRRRSLRIGLTAGRNSERSQRDQEKNAMEQPAKKGASVRLFICGTSIHRKGRNIAHQGQKTHGKWRKCPQSPG